MPDDSFKEFVLDQLSDLGEMRCKAMFGGYGLYHRGIFFGIIADGQLYFKTDANTRTQYEERGMKPFRPNPKLTLKNYYQVPDDILEDGEELVLWARTASSVGDKA